MSRVPAGTLAHLAADSVPDSGELSPDTSPKHARFRHRRRWIRRLRSIDLDAFDANAADLLRRAGGVPLRLASKSLRVRALQDRALSGRIRRDALLHAARGALAGGARLGRSGRRLPHRRPRARCVSWLTRPARERVTVMVDCREHLDAIAAAGGPTGPSRSASTSTRAGASAVYDDRREALAAARSRRRWQAFAREIVARPELELDGLMAYEGQIAGVGDRPPGKPLLRAGAAGRCRRCPRASWRARRGGDRRRGALGRAAALRQRRRDRARSSAPRPSPP